ncbi:unnamed protein product [Lepeophtheirus salmonis]|uniref:(salmon louse) hypothetical protein n=1 Tax=Lepeophtheirus salmonis TaxID=72036 RepID=A0A0K2UFE9_LEPSM|nr:unnamed protein product [Lepeophtheirus salmonis]CAF2830754.1 unnamed protein product [Lepeophtheirus salmonis]
MARSGQVAEVPLVAGKIKIIPFWPDKPKSWCRQLEAQYRLSKVSEETEKYYHLLSGVDDKVLDLFDDEEESLSDTPYSGLKSKILKEYEISTPDKMEIIF